METENPIGEDSIENSIEDSIEGLPADKKLIKDRILKTIPFNWKEFSFIQSESFKELSPKEKKKLKESIIQNDFVESFKAWGDVENEIVYCLDGYHRCQVLKELEEEGYKVPETFHTDFLDCESKEEASKLVLIYSSIYAKTTREGLFSFLEENDLDFLEVKQFIDLPDLSLARFEQQFDLSGIEKEEAETEAISLNEETTIAVKVGDLFKLGEHRLLCGDCLKEENITLLMDGQLAQILCTDPPYNLKTADFQGKGSVKHEDFVMAAGEMSDEEFATFLKQVMQLACKHTIDGGLHYIFMDHRHSWHMGEAARKVYGSPEPKQTCVWKKDIPANGSFYRVQHEFCFIYKYGTAKHKSYLELKDRSRANVWEYAGANSWGNPDRDREGHLSGLGELANHPTPKNSAMIADIFLDVTDEGDIVLEMFSGSGTAIVAGERTKRKVYAIDLKPDFVQSTLIRYYKHCLKHDTPFDFEHVNGEITESLIKEWYEATLTPKEATTNQANAEESNTD